MRSEKVLVITTPICLHVLNFCANSLISCHSLVSRKCRYSLAWNVSKATSVANGLAGTSGIALLLTLKQSPCTSATLFRQKSRLQARGLILWRSSPANHTVKSA